MAKYSYLSDGRKLMAVDSLNNGLLYFGSLVYSQHNNAIKLESVGFRGGRFVATTTGFEPRFHLTDHLGSVRTVVDATGEVVERSDYYPFGMRWNDAQKAIDGINTLQFSHDKDRIAGKNQMQGAKTMNTSKDSKQKHTINSFWDQIKNLPAGSYKFENGEIVPY